ASAFQHYWSGIDLDYYDVEWFYEDIQDLLELTPKTDVLFNIEDWNAKVGIKRYMEVKCSEVAQSCPTLRPHEL
uniref:hypothetical protein n=1 Tax=Pseudomonas aeruginosa TaxID=287 RepID=UPI00397BADDF